VDCGYLMRASCKDLHAAFDKCALAVRLAMQCVAPGR
jgi:hypothetical protein